MQAYIRHIHTSHLPNQPVKNNINMDVEEHSPIMGDFIKFH